jgi:aspartate/methionine/tyrosine aminotransferase
VARWLTISPPSLTGAIRKVHDFLTVGAPAPLQEAGAVALGLPDEHYARLAREYQRRPDVLLGILERHHFTCFKPDGAYYIMTDIRSFDSGRCRVRALPGEGCRRRNRAREQLLQDVERRAHEDPLLFLQAG